VAHAQAVLLAGVDLRTAGSAPGNGELRGPGAILVADFPAGVGRIEVDPAGLANEGFVVLQAQAIRDL